VVLHLLCSIHVWCCIYSVLYTCGAADILYTCVAADILFYTRVVLHLLCSIHVWCCRYSILCMWLPNFRLFFRAQISARRPAVSLFFPQSMQVTAGVIHSRFLGRKSRLPTFRWAILLPCSGLNIPRTVCSLC
jgi:hypothetical protein